MDFFEIAKKWSQAVGISSPSFRNKDHMDILHAILSAEIGDYVIIDKKRERGIENTISMYIYKKT